MAQADFGKWVKELCLYFERKQPAPQTLEQWWEELKAIVPEFYPGISSYLHDLQFWPKNFPHQVKEIASRFKPKTEQGDHPAHYAPWKYADQDCYRCKGEGFNREKATVYSKDGTKSMPLSARVICPACVEPKMTPF